MKKSIIIALIFCVPFISLSNVENNQQEIKPVNLNEPKLPEEKPLKPEFEMRLLRFTNFLEIYSQHL